MKSLIKKIVRRRSWRRSSKTQKVESKLVTKVIGSSSLPASLVDTAHLSILNYPAEEDGVVTEVSLRLGGIAPGDGKDWEVRIYQKTEQRAFILRGKQSIHVDTEATSEQNISITPPLPIRKGQYIGIVNMSGRLSLTYTRGWSIQRGELHDVWDLWYLEEQPDHSLGSRTPPLLMWNGRVGWFAKMAQDPPEPRLVVPVSTLVADMRKVFDDASTMDVTFLIGPGREPVCAHRAIVKARSEYFHAMLSGAFSEGAKEEITLPDCDPHAFRLMLEYLYSDNIDKLGPQDALEVMQLASRYCISSLVAFCEQTVKRFVDYDNVAAIFLISQRCDARQLLAYCAYFSRKYEHHICEAVTPENAMEMSTLARECKLSDLKKVAEPLVSRVDLEHDDVGCGESKSGRDTVTRRQQDEKIICTPKPPPLILSRERMWSA